MYNVDDQPKEDKTDQIYWKRMRYVLLRASTDCFNQHQSNSANFAECVDHSPGYQMLRVSSLAASFIDQYYHHCIKEKNDVKTCQIEVHNMSDKIEKQGIKDT